MHLPLRTAVGLLAFFAAAIAKAEPGLEPPRVIEQPIWLFPQEVARDSVYEGEARVLVSVSEEGELLDFILLGFTHPAFGREVADALPRCKFAPGRVRGEPATTRVPITIHFAQQGTVISMTGGESLAKYVARLTTRPTFTGTVCPGQKLDRPLQTAAMVSPQYPAELRARAESGTVTVDFYVDAEGRVRMPATSAGSHPSFARTAIGAVEQWKFEPPTSGGEPVLVHVQQEFRFKPPMEPPPKQAEGRTASTGATDKVLPASRF